MEGLAFFLGGMLAFLFLGGMLALLPVVEGVMTAVGRDDDCCIAAGVGVAFSLFFVLNPEGGGRLSLSSSDNVEIREDMLCDM